MRALFLLPLTILAVPASALTITGAAGPFTFNDGLGNTATATIEHLSSTAPELDQMYSALASDGYAYQKLPDQAGTININPTTAISDYGYSAGWKVIGFTTFSEQSFTGLDTPLFWGEYDTVDYDNNSGFFTFGYSTHDASYPFDPNHSSDLIGTNFGWVIPEPHFVDTRYFFFGQTIDDGFGNYTVQVTDGMKVTLDVNLTPVPEPGTFVALGLGALAMLRRRRK
jgi:hypothetical protein